MYQALYANSCITTRIICILPCWHIIYAVTSNHDMDNIHTLISHHAKRLQLYVCNNITISIIMILIRQDYIISIGCIDKVGDPNKVLGCSINVGLFEGYAIRAWRLLVSCSTISLYIAYGRLNAMFEY